MAEQKNLARNVHQEEEEWQYIKSYMFIKGFAVGKDLKKTQTALALAKQLHAGQYRKDGTPYISVIMGAEDKTILYEEMNQLFSAGILQGVSASSSN